MRYATMAMLAFSLAAVPAMVGCEETLEHERKVDVKDDGTVIKEERTVTEGADGTIRETETKDVDKVD